MNRSRFLLSIPVRGLIFGICFISVLELSSPSAAQESGTACVARGAGASSIEIAGFKSDPSMLLEASPNGGGILASAIRKLAISDASTLTLISKIISSANPDQSRSIGAGLGQAAILCRAKHPEIATEIQEMIIRADRRDVLASFQAVVGDTLTAAIANFNANEVDNSRFITETLPGGAPFRATATQRAGGVASSPTQLFLIPSTGGGIFVPSPTSGAAFQSVSPSR